MSFAIIRIAKALLIPPRYLPSPCSAAHASRLLRGMARPKRGTAAAAAASGPLAQAGGTSDHRHNGLGADINAKGAQLRPKRRRLDSQVAMCISQALPDLPVDAQAEKSARRAYSTAAGSRAPAEVAEEIEAALADGSAAPSVGLQGSHPSQEAAAAQKLGRKGTARKSLAPKESTKAGTSIAAADGGEKDEQAGIDEGEAKAIVEVVKKKHKHRAKAKGKVAAEVEAAVEAAMIKLEFLALPSSFPSGKLVGCHVSMASGIERAVVNAAAIGDLLSISSRHTSPHGPAFKPFPLS